MAASPCTERRWIGVSAETLSALVLNSWARACHAEFWDHSGSRDIFVDGEIISAGTRGSLATIVRVQLLIGRASCWRRPPDDSDIHHIIHLLPQASTSKMAFAAPSLRMAPASSSLLSRFIPAATSPAPRLGLFLSRQFSLPRLPTALLAIPASVHLSLPSIPSLLEGIWESILRAVPKKKTSHMKKRHRQMAGKALKDVTALCKCPACGRTKKMHYLCPHCASSMSPSLGIRFTCANPSPQSYNR